MTFANDCANVCFFSRKTDAQRKKKFAFGSAKITNGNPRQSKNKTKTVAENDVVCL